MTALYKSDGPFIWNRDGAYDGIKAEAAEIADAIVANKEPFTTTNLTIAHISDLETVIRASATADWVVYAMGFRPRAAFSVIVDGKPVNPLLYDGATGKIDATASAWGFGIAYPNRAPDGLHWDVSIAAFLEHMTKQIPQCVTSMDTISKSP